MKVEDQFPLQQHRTRQLTTEEREALEKHRKKLFKKKTNPVLLEILNTILETDNLIFSL